MRKIFLVLIISIALIFTLLLSKDLLIKMAVEKGVQVVTGLQLKVSKFNVGLIKSLVNIKDLKLYNPSGFKDRIMLSMPQIYVDYNLGSILKGLVHLENVKIHVEEFVVVKNESGQLNLDSLKSVKAQKVQKKEVKKVDRKAPNIQIDNLELKIGKVLYKDYTVGGTTPRIREFNVNINETYKNITNPTALVSLIVVKALMNTSIASLANFDLGSLEGSISDTLKSTQKAVYETATKASATVKDTTEKARIAAEETRKNAEKAVEDTTESLKKTTDDLKGLLKSPFGNQE